MQKNHFGLGLILSLVALRVVIGMHFFREGINKLRNPQPFSAGFFSNAKGPLAGYFRDLTWDRDGLARLEVEPTLAAWDQFRAQVASNFQFDDKQKKNAEVIAKRYETELRDYVIDKEEDITEYVANVQRRERYLADRQRTETPSLAYQIDRIDSDIRKQRNEILPYIDSLWTGYARELNGLATDEQWNGPVTLKKAGRRWLDSETIDRVIPWFDAAIGVLLVMGLATRPAAIAGAVFLFSVMVTQWPLHSGAVPTWPQAIEAFGLIVIAAAGAGRYLGFDALFSALGSRRNRSHR